MKNSLKNIFEEMRADRNWLYNNVCQAKDEFDDDPVKCMQSLKGAVASGCWSYRTASLALVASQGTFYRAFRGYQFFLPTTESCMKAEVIENANVLEWAPDEDVDFLWNLKTGEYVPA